MQTNRLKTFAVEARNTLKKGVRNRILTLGFDTDGNVLEQPIKVEGGAVFKGETQSEDFYNKWQNLAFRIVQKGVREVIEEAAYTWFNRLMAIRIMQRNGLCDPVLAYRSDSVRLPILLTDAMSGNFPAMPATDRERLRELMNDPMRTAEQFAILITAFCHNTPIINKCFGKLADYTELLLPSDILAENGFIDHLNHTEFITDEDYKSPELIGWLYQFYISERKDEVFAKKGKYNPDEIPAATQIFTPNWIVKYMVQNTVGRIYLDNNPSESHLKDNWKYFVENEQQGEILEVKSLEDMKVADLACGSGHILNECFDLLLHLYVNEGYGKTQAIESIFKNNLTGIDLDTRAKQLATFALLLKACQVSDSFKDAHIMPHVLDMPQRIATTIISMGKFKNSPEENVDAFVKEFYAFLDNAIQEYMVTVNSDRLKEIRDALMVFANCDSLGSIMKFDISDNTRFAIDKITAEWKEKLQQGDKLPANVKRLLPYFEIMLALTEHYSALVMNPPYMGNRNMDNNLSNYVKDNYESGKADLCTVFILMQANRTQAKGRYAFIVPPSWMSLLTFEALREFIVNKQSISSLLHLSRGIFGADFGSVSTVIQNHKNKNATGTYFRLIQRTFQEFFEEDLKLLFEATLNNHDFKFDFNQYNKETRLIVPSADGRQIYYPNIKQQDFLKIPGCPIGYWINQKVLSSFVDYPKLPSIGQPRAGMGTGDTTQFLRLWFEASFEKTNINSSKKNQKWRMYNKGGSYRRWYGNKEYIVDYENDGEEMKKGSGYRSGSFESFMNDNISWSNLFSGNISVRFFEAGLMQDSSAYAATAKNKSDLFYLLALMNTKVLQFYKPLLNPTFHFISSDFNSVPLIHIPNEQITKIATSNVSICRVDWDAHETSWDFQCNELIAIDKESFLGILNDYCEFNHVNIDVAPPTPELLEWRMGYFKKKWETKFGRLHANEEELNRQFIDIYGLQDELTPDVPLDEVTILQQGEISIENNEIVWHEDAIIKQFISYAIGCMMGRYRLDKPGLHIAHTNATKDESAPYEYNGEQFVIDDDGIIPLMDKDSMFSDNAIHQMTDFVRLVFGNATQVKNLNFIEQALGKSLEQYFIKDFWKDHKKMYQNRPIYWLFSSKKGAFQCLVYMHRMNKYTPDLVRQKYLLPHMDHLRKRIEELAAKAATLSRQETKLLESLQKQLVECNEYHDRLHPIAEKLIDIDLDDGVVVNYAKFGDILAKLK